MVRPIVFESALPIQVRHGDVSLRWGGERPQTRSTTRTVLTRPFRAVVRRRQRLSQTNGYRTAADLATQCCLSIEGAVLDDVGAGYSEVGDVSDPEL
jgi:hypothetical protein